MKSFRSVFAQSSLVPLAKIANAPSRSLRLLWAIITATMFMGLCVCITLVVIQYCQHQTVFQLDYSGREAVYDQIPGFTICPQAQEAQRMALKLVPNLKQGGLPWQNAEIMNELRRQALQKSPNLSFDVITHRLSEGESKWDTALTAISPIYAILHNFSVSFRMQPPHLMNGYRLTVMEQVPNLRTFMCTTFELRSRVPTDRWSYLEIEIDQTASPSSQVSFTIIIHERGELPFSAYDRHIQTVLSPSTMVSIYFSKSVTKRLNTARNPCHKGMDAKVLAAGIADTLPDPTAYKDGFVNNPVDPSGHHEIVKGSLPYPDFPIGSNLHDATWHTDHLDKVRLKVNDYYAPDKVNDRQNKNSPKHKKTVNLFGTEFLYSREACAWVECCLKVQRNCNCTCSMHVLRFSASMCEAGPKCEVSECRDRQIPYSVCPLPCVMIKFIKQNEISIPASEANISHGLSKLKLVRSEAVQVAMEEEIFSLAKLFSEVGGLCSLFIGFSCIFLFELLEAAILMRENLATNTQTTFDTAGNISSVSAEIPHVSHDQVVQNSHVYAKPLRTKEKDELWQKVKTTGVQTMAAAAQQADCLQSHQQKSRSIARNKDKVPSRINLTYSDQLSEIQPRSNKENNTSEMALFSKHVHPGADWTNIHWEQDTLIVPLLFSKSGQLKFSNPCDSQRSKAPLLRKASMDDEEQANLSSEEFLKLLKENRIKFRMIL